jgi:hypothetical protein
MDSRWFRGVPPDEKEKRKKELLAHRSAFELLAEVLEREFEEGAPNYDCPSWSHKQADRNGANRKLQSILSLINIKES